ncbi:hypothetical protein IAD21_00102 [Abditibacteriota bacterium]|nr:hypothetical protein IAD21_00102 [Abditibacteriota bacterium]
MKMSWLFPLRWARGIWLIGGAAMFFAVPTQAQTGGSSPAPGPNLLKNGSFEGGTRYWYEANLPGHAVVNDAAHGQRAMRLDKTGVQSAAIALRPNEAVTLSYFAKSLDGMATMGWQLTPCDREAGVKAGQTWSMRHNHPVVLTPEWERYSFEFTPTVPQNGFWPRPTYMVQLGDCDKPMLVDGVTVAYANGEKNYVPRRAVEVVVDCPDLPGFALASGNTFRRGTSVRLAGRAFNASDTPKTLALRWQLFDYEGEKAVGPAIEQMYTLTPGQNLARTVSVRLSHAGLVLARFSALEVRGAQRTLIDSSDLPLTSLPYPQPLHALPNPQERFGSSLFGKHTTEITAQLGMRWARWGAVGTRWSGVQPNGPDEWKWPIDESLNTREEMGISSHIVLHGTPSWAYDGRVLPKDMQWAPDDPRWADLSVKTAWDNFIVGVVNHYRGRPVVFELENEPEFNQWDKFRDEYALFYDRTARLIKQTDPQARVMVNNVYSIPSAINWHLLNKFKGRCIDIISWHDYHEGWLTTGPEMARMKARLKELGAGHLEIWFNEGWAYTNTAQDEPALALTQLTGAQSANALVASLAELMVNGQDKCIVFHSAYEDHGMSFWDYAGPGTMLWDYNSYPLPLVGAWNTLIYHIGLSQVLGWVRPPGANFCVFQDERNHRGVLVAYADREAARDVTVALPFQNVVVEDIMGNAAPLKNGRLTLSKTGRPMFIYTTNKTAGRVLLARLVPLDRAKRGFVDASGQVFRLPLTWQGVKNESSEGNPAMANGRPVWRLDQIWPPDGSRFESHRPLVWRDRIWQTSADSFGGQPAAEPGDNALPITFRAPHGDPPVARLASLSFIAPQSGTYRLHGNVELHLWDGDVRVRLQILRRSREGNGEISTLELKRNERLPLEVQTQLGAGDELVLVPRPDGMYVGGDIVLRDLEIVRTR